MEFFRSNEKPDQIWRKDPDYPEGSEGPRWMVFFIDEAYHHLLDADRFNDIPPYGISGSMTVSGKNEVLTAFDANPDFDAAKIAACALRKR